MDLKQKIEAFKRAQEKEQEAREHCDECLQEVLTTLDESVGGGGQGGDPDGDD